MNRNDTLEKALKRCLSRRAESIEVTSEDTERLRCLVHRKIEEESGMRKWNARKIVIMAAAVCMLGTVTAIAAGKVVFTASSSSHKDRFAYSQLGDMEQKNGFATKAPETFANGYTFEYGLPVHNEGRDEEQNVVKTAESLSLYYSKEGMPYINVDIQGTALYDQEGEADQTFSHGGITVGYGCDQYRFVPPDYQISQEEQALVDAGELFISYGSDKVENSQIQFVVWQDAGVRYCMLTSDNSITAEELAQMAGEIIDNK